MKICEVMEIRDVMKIRDAQIAEADLIANEQLRQYADTYSDNRRDKGSL